MRLKYRKCEAFAILDLEYRIEYLSNKLQITVLTCLFRSVYVLKYKA
jgi:hypothetical protein